MKIAFMYFFTQMKDELIEVTPNRELNILKPYRHMNDQIHTKANSKKKDLT